MKKRWIVPKVNNITLEDTKTCNHFQCNNSICISKCEVCEGCIGSNTKIQQCSYYKNLAIKKCANAESGGCKLRLS